MNKIGSSESATILSKNNKEPHAARVEVRKNPDMQRQQHRGNQQQQR